MTYETVKLEHDGALAILTLNRPEKMNSLSDQLLADFRAAIDTCERDDSVRALIITGAGRAFSAGFDISPAKNRARPCRIGATMPRTATRRGCASGARACRLWRQLTAIAWAAAATSP